MKSEFRNLHKIGSLLKTVQISPVYFIIPFLLGMLAAAFEGASLSLLIPMLNGFLTQDYSFIAELPILSDVIRLLPSSITGTDRHLFIVLLGLLVITVFCKSILTYASACSLSYLSQRTLHHLRKHVFERMISFGKLYFDTTDIGHQSTILLQFTKQALQPIFSLHKYASALFSFIAYVVLMIVISWKLTLYAFPLFIVLHFAIRFLIKKIQGISHTIASSDSALTQKAIEVISSIPIIKASYTYKHENAAFKKLSDQRAKEGFTVSLYNQMISPLQEMITLLSAALLFVLMMGIMVYQGDGTPPSFMVYFYLVLNAANKFRTLTGIRSTLATIDGPLSQIEAIFSDEHKEFVQSGSAEFTGNFSTLSLKNISFSYDDRNVIEDIDINFHQGATTAIVGPTGSGKTTLVNLIMRFYDCKPGQMFIDDADIRDFSIQSLMKHIALVSQDTFLFHDSIRNNIAYGVDDVSDEQIQHAVERARLSSFIDKLPDGLDTIVGDKGEKLSGGEKQRVSIARALLKDSPILILDEATSALDSTTEQMIQEAIDDAIANRTAIVIAHRLSTVAHADHIVVMNEGKVEEQGTREDLLAKKGLFAKLWEAQTF